MAADAGDKSKECRYSDDDDGDKGDCREGCGSIQLNDTVDTVDVLVQGIEGLDDSNNQSNDCQDGDGADDRDQWREQLAPAKVGMLCSDDALREEEVDKV